MLWNLLLSAATAAPKVGLYADLGMGLVNGAVEIGVHTRTVVQLSAGLYGPWYQWRGTQLLGHAVGVRTQFCLTDPTVCRLYLAPAAYGGALRAEGTEARGPAWMVRLPIGASRRFGEHIVGRLGGGLQYHAAEVALGGEVLGFRGLYPTIDWQIGWQF